MLRAITIFAVSSMLCTMAAAQTPAEGSESKPIPRMPDGKPDFNGFFDLPYFPNMASGKEETVPYTPAGRAAYLNHDAKDDPTANCWFPGVPRIMESPYPAQFVQTHDYIIILFEYMHTFRTIPLSGRPHPADMTPAFMGDSTGHWEGDTLVVDTSDLKDGHWTWLDTAGHQHSDKLHVVEKFQRTPDSILYQFTVEDPVMYSKPWTFSRTFNPLKMIPGEPPLLEYSCSENNRDLKHLISTKPALNPPQRPAGGAPRR
ncbi:MAG: hypothetical protein ACRD30_03260 [Bryobacteraceae bacterium]